MPKGNNRRLYVHIFGIRGRNPLAEETTALCDSAEQTTALCVSDKKTTALCVSAEETTVLCVSPEEKRHCVFLLKNIAAEQSGSPLGLGNRIKYGRANSNRKH